MTLSRMLRAETSGPAQRLPLRSGSVRQASALQHLADASLAVTRLAGLQALGGGQAPAVQMKKKKKGVEYAESEREATQLMRDYATHLDLEFDKLNADLREHAVRVAQAPEEGGIDGAERLIWGEFNSIRESERREERAAAIQDDADNIEGFLEDDDLALAAFRIARQMYVGGAEVNGGVAGPWTKAEFDDALRLWCRVKAKKTVFNFHAFKPSDKAEQGKGNVGATLATRKVQGNLLCAFQGRKINIHADIEG